MSEKEYVCKICKTVIGSNIKKYYYCPTCHKVLKEEEWEENSYLP